MLFIIISLEVLLAVIALKELGLKVALAAFGIIFAFYLWVSTHEIRGNYITLERSEIPCSTTA